MPLHIIYTTLVTGTIMLICTAFFALQSVGVLNPVAWEVFSVCFLVLLGIIGVSTILSVGFALGYSAMNKGTEYLFKDMKYLGFDKDSIEVPDSWGSSKRTYPVSALVISNKSETEPLNRFFAFLAYRGDILTRLFTKRKDSYAERSDQKGNLRTNNTDLINNQLRREVFQAISIESKLFKSGEIQKIEDSLYPLASYLFVANETEKNTKTYDRTKFFYENQFPLSAAKQLQAVDMDTLKEFSDVPPTWVVRLLIPTVES
jgi:hypothetical protein